jgi:uncharacterized membrane protein YgaE (UPF0421/DUF939 family)
MKQNTIDAIKTLIANARKTAGELHNKKRKNQSDVWEEAVLYRDIAEVEIFIEDKVARKA